jgi:hypothetical protein
VRSDHLSGRWRRLCVATPVPTTSASRQSTDRQRKGRNVVVRSDNYMARTSPGTAFELLQPRANLRTSKCHHHKIPGARQPHFRGAAVRVLIPVVRCNGRPGLKRWPDGEHWRGVFPCPGILSSRNSKSYLRMAPWRSRSSPRAATTPSADCPIAVTSLNLVSCRRTLASDMPDRAAAATITQPRPPKFDTWHSASPQKPQGGAGQDDASEAGQR